MLSAETTDIIAFWSLAILALALLVQVVWMMRRSPFTTVQSLLYVLNYLIARILWRTEIKSQFPVPREAGAVIVCNHRCPLDPSFIAIAVPRVVRWMVAREYYESAAFHELLSICRVIPVSRGGSDTAATKAAIRLLRQGEVVGIFPEGRINTSSQTLLPGRPGAALLALRAGVPIVPCYIEGAPYDGTTLGCLFMPARVRVWFGSPIVAAEACEGEADRGAIEALTRRFLCAIAELGGDRGFQPKLATRFYKPA